jgi:hypothetical protein
MIWSISFLFIFILFLPAHSEQLGVVKSYLLHKNECSPEFFFVNSKENTDLLIEEKLKVLSKKKDLISSKNIKNLNLIPVDNCVLRGNRNFTAPQEAGLLRDLNVDNIINTDFLSHQINKDNVRTKYSYLPLTASAYPKGQDAKNIIVALEKLANGSPSQKVYLSCFFGKHRTGLLVGLYQFLRLYSQNPKETCTNLGKDSDAAYSQMLKIASQGKFTYDMPKNFIKFYKDFGRSVCDNSSAEFVASL